MICRLESLPARGPASLRVAYPRALVALLTAYRVGMKLDGIPQTYTRFFPRGQRLVLCPEPTKGVGGVNTYIYAVYVRAHFILVVFP